MVRLWTHLLGNCVLVLLVGCGSNKDTSEVDSFFDNNTEFGEVGNSALSFTPDACDFGPVTLFSASPTYTFTIKNTSRSTVYLNSIGDSANTSFTMSDTSCPQSPAGFASGAECTASVVFTPTSSGPLDYLLKTKYGANAGEEEFTSSAGCTGIGAGPLVFAGLENVTNVTSNKADLSWTDVANENGYMVFNILPGGTPVFLKNVPTNSNSVTLTGLTPSTSYTLRVRAIDYFGGTDTNTADHPINTLDAPTLTDLPDRTFLGAGPIPLGGAVAFDVNNEANSTSNDTDMSYSCAYDEILDGSVSPGSACSGIPELSLDGSFATNGRFTFTAAADSYRKAYEIKITGNDGSGDVSEIIKINTVAPYKRDGSLLVDIQGAFANEGPGMNSPFDSTWLNLVAGGSALNGLLSSGTFSTGWVGDGITASDPYALTFDGNSGGSADRVNLGTGLNGQTQLMFTSWLKFLDKDAGERTIMGNGGGPGNGWALKQTTDGRAQLIVGSYSSPNYTAEVLADSPDGYWRLGEGASGAVADATGNGNAGTTQNSGNIAFGETGVLDPIDSDTAMRFTSSGYVRLDSDLDIGTTWTIETWFKYPFPSGCWCTLTRGSNDHQVLADNSGNEELGSYDNSTSSFIGSGFNMNTLSPGWHHLVAVASGGTTTFYIDGASVGSIAFVSDTDIRSIGNYFGGGQAFGTVDEVAIYPTALSPARISAHYGAGSVSGCSGGSLGNDFWTHVGGTWDGTDANLYINGVNVCSYAYSGTTAGATEDFVIGANADGTEAWNGEVASLQVYDSGVAGDITGNRDAEKEHFSPFGLEGMELWLDGGDATTLFTDTGCSTGVTQIGVESIACWRDKSSNAHTLTQSGGNRPQIGSETLNSLNVLSFSSDYLLGGNIMGFERTDAFQVFMLFRSSSNGRAPLAKMLGGSPYTGWDIWMNSGTQIASHLINSWSGNAMKAAHTYTHSTTNILSYLYDGSSAGSGLEMYRNGALAAQASVSPNALSGSMITAAEFSVGSRNGSSTFDGMIAEVLIFQNPAGLNALERQTIEGYLACKWNLQGDLPGGHPYKATCP